MTRRSLRSRLARLETTATAIAPPSPRPALPADDSGDLARELAADFGRLVEGYRRHVAPTAEEAARLAADSAAAATERALTCPPDQLTWFELYAVEQSNPRKALDRWEEVKAAALAELRDGFRAARALDAGEDSCWVRAQFLALRAELQEEWQPQNGLERQLIDQIAQHRTLMLRWQETLAAWTVLASFAARRQARGTDPYEAPRLSHAEALEQAAGMVERFAGLYLRTQRTLLDLVRERGRRGCPSGLGSLLRVGNRP
jgi:hypothetical protein